MPDPTERQPNSTEKQIAQTEVVLANLRGPALDALVNEGITSAYTSRTSRTDRGLEVETTNDKTREKSKMLVNGDASSSGLLGVTLVGNFTVSHMDGKGVLKTMEQDKFELNGSGLDAWMQRPDKFNSQLTRADMNGNPFQVYKPAISEAQYNGRTPILDPNGQNLRLATFAGSDANCGKENIANPGNRRYECDYLIQKDQKGQAKDGISYNEVREKMPSGIYLRSVARDGAGKVLGIVEQSYKLDANGDPVDIKTTARKPQQLKK